MKEPDTPFPIEITTTDLTEVTNEKSGEKCMLPPVALGMYDHITGCELMLYNASNPDSDIAKTTSEADLLMLINHCRMRIPQGKRWFQEHYPKEYYILLD